MQLFTVQNRDVDLKFHFFFEEYTPRTFAVQHFPYIIPIVLAVEANISGMLFDRILLEDAVGGRNY